MNLATHLTQAVSVKMHALKEVENLGRHVIGLMPYVAQMVEVVGLGGEQMAQNIVGTQWVAVLAQADAAVQDGGVYSAFESAIRSVEGQTQIRTPTQDKRDAVAL